MSQVVARDGDVEVDIGKEDSTWDSSGLMKASTLGAIMERVRMVRVFVAAG